MNHMVIFTGLFVPFLHTVSDPKLKVVYSNSLRCISEYVIIDGETYSAHIQWNPSITDTFGTQNFEVSLSQGLPV